MPVPSSRPEIRSGTRPEVRRLVDGQAAVISRTQLLGLGLTPAQARAPVEADRWRTVHPGVYVTHRGDVTPHVRIWAAVLAAGPGAAAGPFTTVWLQGLADTRPRVVDLWIPHERRVRLGPEIWGVVAGTSSSTSTRWPPHRS